VVDAAIVRLMEASGKWWPACWTEHLQSLKNVIQRKAVSQELVIGYPAGTAKTSVCRYFFYSTW
jgi:hypothetical protein